MDAVTLPMYRAEDSTPIEQVLKELRNQARSGVVIEKGDEYRLIYLGDLLQARADGVQRLQDIALGEPVLLLNNLDAQNFHVDLVRPLKTLLEFGALFTAYDRSYALAGATTQTAMVVTRSEDFAQDLMQTGGYVCNGATQHYFPKPRVTAGSPCPRVACRRADGSPSTVSPAP